MRAQRIPQRLDRVMIVSTDTDLTLLLQFLLETDEFQVTVSETRDSAMQALLIDPPEAIFFDLSFEDGKILNLLEFIQSAFPRIAIFTVVRPEQRAWAEKSLETTVQGCLSTPVDYRGVRTLLADAGSRKHRLTYRTSNPASLSVN